MKKLLFLIIGILVLPASVYASGISQTIPFCDTYDKILNEYYGYSFTQWKNPDKYFVNVLNEKLAIHTGNDSDYQAVMLQRSFMPVVSGKLIIEYTMNIPKGSYLMSYADFPGLITSEINEYNSNVIYSLMSFTGMRAGLTKMRGNIIPDLSFENGKDYRFKFCIDIDKKTYTAYVDGTLLSDADGNTEFTMTAKDIIGVEFRCESTGAGNNLIYLDDLYIHRDERYYFVSPPSGNDSNDGGFKTPLKTIEKAVELNDKNKGKIILLDGEYEVDNTFKLDDIDRNYKKDAVILEPYYGADIKVTGSYINEPISISAATQELQRKFMTDIQNDYKIGYSSMPIDVTLVSMTDSDGNKINEFSPGTTATANMRASNNGAIDEDYCIILSMYDEMGRLCGISMNSDISVSGTGKDFSMDIIIPDEFKAGYSIKCFLWNGMSKLQPIGNANVSSLETGNVNPYLTDVRATMIQNGIISLTGKAKAKQEISIVIKSETGTVAYTNQITADENGNFGLICKTNLMNFGNYKINISCMED